jgi:hypothetical protein
VGQLRHYARDVVSISGVVPDPADASDPQRRAAMERSLEYMGLTPGTKMEDIPIDKVGTTYACASYTHWLSDQKGLEVIGAPDHPPTYDTWNMWLPLGSQLVPEVPVRAAPLRRGVHRLVH